MKISKEALLFPVTSDQEATVAQHYHDGLPGEGCGQEKGLTNVRLGQTHHIIGN